MSSMIPRNLIKHLEWSPEMEAPQISSPAAANISPSNTGIQSSDDFWTISGVHYRGEICQVDLMKKLLDDDNSRTQDTWADHYKAAKPKGEFHSLDFPLLYGLVKSLYTVRSDADKKDEIELARQFLQNTSRSKWLTTLTRIAYSPDGNDLITHNFKTDDEYLENTRFAGSHEWIKDTSTPQIYRSLLGSEDVQEVNDVFKWMNETDTYLWRVGPGSKDTDLRVAWFDADSSGAVLSCGRDPTYTNSSLGVRVARKK